MNKKILPVLLLILALTLPMGAAAAESSRTEAYYHIASLPACWDPTQERTEEAELILRLTADRLYTLSPDGSILTPSLAVELPRDVTAEYAGSYGIPQSASRGYAFVVTLSPEARWENGNPITSEDFLTAINRHIDERTLNIGLANLQDYYDGAEKTAEQIISLSEAGFSSLAEAVAQGYTAFYVDTTRFWGLNSGWVSIHDRTRLKDTAIPSGITEMYVSGAYLYSRYLEEGASMSRVQSRYLGVAQEYTLVVREDIGLLALDSSSFLLILQRPATCEVLALKLLDLIPVPQNKYAENYATSPSTYSACGPFRIVSVKDGVMELAPNPNYGGSAAQFQADLIRLLEIGA